MGDVGIPLRRNCHVCRMGGRYHHHDGDAGDDDGGDGDGSWDVDGGGGGNCKVIYIHSCNALPVRNMIPISITSQNWNYLDSVYFVVTSLLKANIDLL